MKRPTAIESIQKKFINGRMAAQLTEYDWRKVVAYIETLEAERDTFKHKASQYDSIVAALKVADGGRFRNDTIDALLSRLRQLEDEDEREA